MAIRVRITSVGGLSNSILNENYVLNIHPYTL